MKKDLPPATALLCPQLNSTSSCVQLEGIELKTGHCMYCKPFALHRHCSTLSSTAMHQTLVQCSLWLLDTIGWLGTDGLADGSDRDGRYGIRGQSSSAPDFDIFPAAAPDARSGDNIKDQSRLAPDSGILYRRITAIKSEREGGIFIGSTHLCSMSGNGR